MSLGEGEIVRHDPVENIQNPGKSIDQDPYGLIFPDQIKSLQNNPSIKNSLEKIYRKTKRIDQGKENIQVGLQKYLNKINNPVITNNISVSDIEKALNALSTQKLFNKNKNGESVAIDPGEVFDHLYEVSYTLPQEKNQLTQATQEKKQLIEENKLKDETIRKEREETAKEREETAKEREETAQKKEAVAQKDEVIEIAHIESLNIAKQKADLIQAENSEKFLNAQQQTESSLRIDESQLAESPLTRTDLTKLITLQRDESLRDEDIFTNDDDKQNLRTYLSDGSFESLKDNLGIIDSIDDLAQPDAAQQIPGFTDAHTQEFSDQVAKYPKEHQTLAHNVIEHLPQLGYQAPNGKTKPSLDVLDRICNTLGIDKTSKEFTAKKQEFVKGIIIIQKDSIGPLSEEYQELADSATEMVADALQKQTEESIKQTTQQNYLGYVSELFGSMGEHMDVDPSTITYDKSTGMQIPFSIDGHQFLNPITIHQEITGPKIIDNQGNHTNGKEYTPALNLGLKTMSDIIGGISLTSVLDADSYEEFQNNLSTFSKEQKTQLESEDRSDHVKVERYATKLRVENETRSFALLDRFDGQNPKETEKNLDATDAQYQKTYNLIYKTTKFNSTSENVTLAKSLDSLSHAIHTARIRGLSDQFKEPYTQLLLSNREDNGKNKTDVPSRSHEILSKFTTPSGYINTQDLNLFSQYINTIVQQRNPTLTFSSYLDKSGQTLSNTSQSKYIGTKIKSLENNIAKQDTERVAELEKLFQEPSLGEPVTMIA